MLKRTFGLGGLLACGGRGGSGGFRLRAGGQADIKYKEITLANEQTERYVWTVTLGCEIVFNTVDRANVDPGV